MNFVYRGAENRRLHNVINADMLGSWNQMNDFTKDELKDIAEAIDGWFSNTDCDSWEGLYLKIKRMIDNYCEHNNTHDCKCCGLVGCEDCGKPCGGVLADD
jgi:hypothetical protein